MRAILKHLKSDWGTRGAVTVLTEQSRRVSALLGLQGRRLRSCRE
jgi:hypothetical protein